MPETLTFDQGVKLVETAAIIVGGLWTLWQFHALKKEKLANLKVEGSIREIEGKMLSNKATLNEMLRQQPNLSVKINVEETVLQEQLGLRFLSIQVTLK